MLQKSDQVCVNFCTQVCDPHNIRPDQDVFNFHPNFYSTVSAAQETFLLQKKWLTLGQLFKKQLTFEETKTSQLPSRSPISFYSSAVLKIPHGSSER